MHEYAIHGIGAPATFAAAWACDLGEERAEADLTPGQENGRRKAP
jgi:hypothetical protein